MKYGFLKAYPIAYDTIYDDNHLYIHGIADEKEYCIAINVASAKAYDTRLYYTLRSYKYGAKTFLNECCKLPDGITRGKYLDYFKFHWVDPELMTQVERSSGSQTHLEDQLIQLLDRCMDEPNAYVMAFGRMWEDDEKDRVFGFYPSRGIHDVHCNQKSPKNSQWNQYDKPDRDGALFICFPDEKRIYGLFSMFR